MLPFAMNRAEIEPGRIDERLSDALRKKYAAWTDSGGGRPPTITMEPVFVSLCYYAYTLALCELLGRQMIVRRLPERFARLALELCATLQGCLCVFENGAFRRFYGGTAYIAAASTVSFVNRSLKRGAFANPASLTEVGAISCSN